MSDHSPAGLPLSPLRVGTRGSALALAQSTPIAAKLGAQLVVIEPDDEGSTERLRAALRAGDVDVAIHSYRELPSDAVPGLVVAAVTKRRDARDAWCSRDGASLADLASAGRVGAVSARRRAQLLARHSQLTVVELGGDIESHLDALATGEVDGVVLAATELDAVGRLDAVTEFFSIDEWPTAPGQGSLAIEVRQGDERTVSALGHRPSRLAVDAERGVLAQLGVGTDAPIGVHALLDDGLLFLSARAYSRDGSAQLTSAHALYPDDSADASSALAERVSAELRAAGADELVRPGGAAVGLE